MTHGEQFSNSFFSDSSIHRIIHFNGNRTNFFATRNTIHHGGIRGIEIKWNCLLRPICLSDTTPIMRNGRLLNITILPMGFSSGKIDFSHFHRLRQLDCYLPHLELKIKLPDFSFKPSTSKYCSPTPFKLSRRKFDCRKSMCHLMSYLAWHLYNSLLI